MRGLPWPTLLVVSLGLFMLAGCQQPYQVFAVQIAKAAPPQQQAASVPQPVQPRRKRTARVKWDLNRVPASTLMALPGISKATVTAIIAGRPYRAKRELLKRAILTPAQYAKWKNFLVVHRSDSRALTSARGERR